MKACYIVAVLSPEPLSEAALTEAFGSEDLAVTFEDGSAGFAIVAEETRIEVAFEARQDSLGWTPDLLTGAPEARATLEAARGFYRVSLEPGEAQGPVAVFEALWAARSLLEQSGDEGVVVDVTAFKVHLPQDIEEITELEFDIRDHLTIHAVEVGDGEMGQWLHTHGLAKFGSPDVELFNVVEDDLAPAESFFHELCMDIAFGQGPTPRAPVATSVGLAFQLLPSDEARATLYGVDPETFDGHGTGYLTVVNAEGRHTMSEILSQYRERFEEESEEETRALKELVDRLVLPFKARFQRKGLMEPLTFLVRAPFEIHPDGENGDSKDEQLWVEVVTWDDSGLVGKLVDGGQRTTEWRKGAHVEVDERQLTALALSSGGASLGPDQMEALLMAERPA